MTDTTDKITSWPPNIDEWQSGSGQTLRLNGREVFVLRGGSPWWFLNVPNGTSRATVWNEEDCHWVERWEKQSPDDAALAGFNRLIELGIIKRRPVSPVDSSVDCDGPVDDAPIFLDNLE